MPACPFSFPVATSSHFDSPTPPRTSPLCLSAGLSGNSPACLRDLSGLTVNLPFFTTYLLSALAKTSSPFFPLAGRTNQLTITIHFASHPSSLLRTSYHSYGWISFRK